MLPCFLPQDYPLSNDRMRFWGVFGVFLCKTFPKFRYLLHICKEYEVDKIQGYKITIKSKNQFPI